MPRFICVFIHRKDLNDNLKVVKAMHIKRRRVVREGTGYLPYYRNLVENY